MGQTRETRIETPDGLSLAMTHHYPDDSAAADEAQDGTKSARGTVLLAHGITQDMDEGGMFIRLAECLIDAGFNVARFSFRGHGDSDGTDRGATIAGERLDFETAFAHLKDQFPGPFFVIAKSFGAVSTSLSLDRFEDDITGLVLWNPVLDIEGTFLNPSLPWGKRNFTSDQLTQLETEGYLSIDGRFAMGRVLYDELARYDPGVHFKESSVPALVVHGDKDGIVPYEDTRRVAKAKGADFHTIEGGSHGFVRSRVSQAPEERREHDRRTVEWITNHV